MSKEVSVNGIKMTASVPEGVEVSLGYGMILNNALTVETTGDTPATNATRIKAPTNNSSDLTIDKDWTNSVAVSDYYQFGYLLPASSINGTDIWYTNDANNAGRSVNVDATFAQADGGANAYTGNLMTSYGVGATYEDFDAEENVKGYYIDIPVWFRTSAADDIELGVVATITQGRLEGENVVGKGAEDEGTLYKAARVAILNANSAANSDSAGQILYGSNFYGASASTGIEAISGAYYNRFSASYGGAAITSPQAVMAAGDLDGELASGVDAASDITNADEIYGTASFVAQATLEDDEWDGDTVVTVTKPTGTNNYGAAVEKTIRVWLEGEDQNCWNPNAGQSFTIDLKFVRLGEVAAPTAANS